MIRATSIIRRDAVDPDRIVDVITLDHGDRHRRRIVLNADGGTAFLLDLDKADVLEDGDAIRLETRLARGGEGRAREARRDPGRRSARPPDARLAHRQPARAGRDHARRRSISPTIMCWSTCSQGLGATIEIVERPFRPVRGAYHHHEHGGHAIITDTAMAERRASPAADEAQRILPLFAWLSPSYPVGSYAYSHTLEWAVEAGDVTDEATLVAWLADLLTLGSAATTPSC